MRTALSVAATTVAWLLVLFALLGTRPGIPVDGVVLAALLVALPVRWRRVVALAVGGLLGLVTVLRLLDVGFQAALARPFHPVYDLSALEPAFGFLASTAGTVVAVLAAVGAVLLALAVVVLTALGAHRLSRIMATRRATTLRVAGALVAVSVLASVPVGAASGASTVYGQASQTVADLRDQRAFERDLAVDAFGGARPDQLLTALRGKDVLITFVESYGRVAVQDSDIAASVDAVLDSGTDQLRGAGYASRSAFLTSPTFGGISWLAHSTLESGAWVSNQRRYDHLLGTDRFTLARAFGQAGWRTVDVIPENDRDWPQGSRFYGYQQVYDSRTVGYTGPRFSYSAVPDQFTLAALQRLERTPGHAPLMAEIDLVTSHTPWEPLPTMVGWDQLGDGSVFGPMPAAGRQPGDVWPDPTKVRASYGESIRYTLGALVSYVLTYGDDNLVLVFLGDHQPAPIVSGAGAGHDVPIAVVARDPAVIARIDGWGWQDGLRPRPDAPVWPMSAFRDRFLTAFG